MVKRRWLLCATEVAKVQKKIFGGVKDDKSRLKAAITQGAAD